MRQFRTLGRNGNFYVWRRRNSNPTQSGVSDHDQANRRRRVSGESLKTSAHVLPGASSARALTMLITGYPSPLSVRPGAIV
jgi:hypothetical protein